MLVLKINEDPVKMQDRLQCLLNPASGKPVKVQTKLSTPSASPLLSRLPPLAGGSPSCLGGQL